LVARESDERDHLSGRLAEKWGQKKRENTIAVSGLDVKIGHEFFVADFHMRG